MRAFLALLSLATATNAAAQPLTIFSSNATKALIEELAPQYEKTTGQQLTLVFDSSASLRTRIEKGEAFDVLAATAPTVAALAKSGRIDQASRTDMARAGVGMAIHRQGTRPYVDSIDTLRGALVTAESITYVEQGATASVLRGLFAKLGLTEAMDSKTVYSDSAAHAVAEGKAQIGFTQISEILNVAGALYAGPLPPDVQVYTTFTAGAHPKAPAAAKQFIAFMTSAQAAPVIRKTGMETLAGDRLPPIPAAQLTPAQREAVDAFKTARGGDITGPFHPLLRSPELMMRTRAMGDYLRFRSALPPRLSEFVILMTAREWMQQYEWNAHYPIALKAGLRKDIADAVGEGRRPSQMAADEAALYEFCQELHRNKTVSDATYAQAVAAFGEHGVVDAIGISGYYSMLAMVLNTARTPTTDNGSPMLRPVSGSPSPK